MGNVKPSPSKKEGGLRVQNHHKQSLPDKPLISVVTVVYNGEKYVEQTIKSVLGQTYDNVEYIVVDGGSKDNSLNIIKKYEDKIDYWVSEPDNGISDAINKGIKLCTGDFIGLIHSDDWYESDTIENIIESTKNHDIIHGVLQYWDENNKGYSFTANHDLLKKEMTMNHPTVFVKKTIYEQFGMFDNNYKLAMDYELLLRFYINDAKFAYVNKTLANMRLMGVSDRNWWKAYQEAKTAKIALLGNSLSHHLYFYKQVIKSSVSRFLQKSGLNFIVQFYRKKLSVIKKTDK